MLFQEPPRTAYDLRFRLGDIPVRVHPMFWLACAFLGIGGSDRRIEILLIWMFSVFVSILVHELGHAVTSRAFGGRPAITLYAFGGLASYTSRGMTRGQRIAITLAGPAAGFALAGLIVALLSALGIGVRVRGGWIVPLIPLRANPYLFFLTADLLQINVWWGLINLLPIQPLDGGRVTLELLTARRPRGLYQSFMLSTCVAGAVALYGVLALQDWFLALFFGYLAVSSYQTLQAMRGYAYEEREPWR